MPISYIFERKHIKTKSGLVPYKKYTTTQWLIKISAIKETTVLGIKITQCQKIFIN